jgi:hypothetical protein
MGFPPGKKHTQTQTAMDAMPQEPDSTETVRKFKAQAAIYMGVRLHREASERLTELRECAVPATANEEEGWWTVMSLALDREQRYMAASEFEV